MNTLPNHTYFETEILNVFSVFEHYFPLFYSYLTKKLNFRPCLKYILSVVKLYFMKGKTSLINLQCILFNKYD